MNWADLDFAYVQMIKNLHKSSSKIIILTIIFFSEGDLMDDFRVILSATVVIAAPSTFSFWAIKLSKTISEIYLPVEIYRALGSPSNFAKTHVV